MDGLIFVVVIVAALVAIVYRKWKQKGKVKRYRTRKGHSPEKAWLIHSYNDINPKVRHQRCHCGGPLYARAETTLVDQPSIRVASCECPLCEEKVRLYFRLEYLN